MVIRIPIFRFATGFHWFTVHHGRVTYGSRRTIASSASDWFITREEYRGLVLTEVRYTLCSQDGEAIAFVRGYRRRNKNFYIERIQRVTDKQDGLDLFRLLGETVEKDLRKRRYRCATILAPARLAPILMKKIGVHSVRGIAPVKLRRGWRSHIPWKMILLRKF